VVPLPAPDVVAADRRQPLSVPLEGGQTVVIDIALGAGTCGEERVYLIQLTYRAPTAVIARLPAPRPERSPPSP